MSLWIILGAALVGLGVSIAQSQHFYQLLSGSGGFKSYCNLGETMNCDFVATSRFAEILPGIPLSSLAAGWFLAVAILALLTLGESFRAAGSRALRAMGAFGLGVSLFYIGVMTFVLHTGCIMCIFVDVALMTIFLASWFGLSREPAELPYQRMAAVLGISLFISIIALKGMDEAKTRELPVEAIVAEVVSSPVVAVNSGPEFPSIGPANAPITIVEFSDFQCPFCRLTAVTLKALTQRFPGQIRIVLRNFPLHSECNRAATNSPHPMACDAARGALCANRQGKFEAMYEAIFENQAELKPGKIQALAASAGVDSAGLPGCMASPEVAAAISKDVEEGLQLGVQSTPTLFVNGHRVSGGYPLPVWIKIVNALLGAK